MTKTLTEQWREGTLAGGDYYIKTKGLGIDKIIINYYEEELKQFDGLCDCSVDEVLAPVPSYSEYQALKDNCELTHTRLKGTHQKITQLEKRLEIATKALERIDDLSRDNDGINDGGIIWCVSDALKEMEGVK